MFALALVLLDLVRLEPRIAGIGQALVRRGGAIGDFSSGALVTIVATPCTAPFMAAALGFALAAPAWAGAVVFVALGLGLALPYLVLSHVPQLIRALPKPGPWMVRLKRLLAIPMLASAAWLLWVLVQQAGYAGLAAALGGLLLIAFAGWAMRVGVAGMRAWAGRGAAALALIVPVAFAWLPTPGETSARNPALAAGEDWLPYTRARLNAALEAGKPVFIDLTAAWCLTCKVNEWGALAAPRVRRAFDAAETVRLRGDWTNRDPEITALLSEHGRIGVPLYLYFPKGQTNAMILPQILTEAEILRAVAN
jgi:thiol:disulfide interchange protein DsbD